MPKTDRQLVYIDSYPSPFPSFSSLFSLVSSISAIYRAPSSFVEYHSVRAVTITVYKSQGLTLLQAALNLNQREHCLDLSYVAVSRVKALDGVLFKVPFDFEHFTHKDSAVSQD